MVKGIRSNAIIAMPWTTTIRPRARRRQRTLEENLPIVTPGQQQGQAESAISAKGQGMMAPGKVEVLEEVRRKDRVQEPEEALINASLAGAII